MSGFFHAKGMWGVVELVSQQPHHAVQVQRIKADVQNLGLAMAKVTDTAQAMKRGKGGIKKDVLDQLNMAWVAAEKCNVWLEDIQVQ